MTSNEQNSENKKEEIPLTTNNLENNSPNKDKKMETEKISEEPEKYFDLNLITRKWRVKFYKLNDIGQWDDSGIGYVFCASKVNELNEKINKLIMISEINSEEMFNIDLSEINREFHFQRATIMTWNESDGEDDDTAISFQEKEGFIEIIRSIFLCEGKNIKMENLLDDNYLEVSLQNLPNLAKIINPEMSEMKLNDFITDLKNNNYEFIIKLGEILEEEEKKIENLKTSASSNVEMEKCEENNNRIIKIELGENDEVKENNKNSENNDYNQQLIYKNLPMKNINYIFNIFKNLVLIGDQTIIKTLVNDELYLITFGALEYDFEKMKSIPHRKYFKNIVKFKNPLNIKNEEIINKINQNLRLTYLRDTALGRLIEDNAVKTINTILQYNHNDIIQFFLNNPIYLEMLLDQLKSNDLNIKKEACLFLSEIIECSKDVLQTRSTFNEYLFEQGILSIIGGIIEEYLLNDKDDNNSENKEKKEFIKITVIEIFVDVLISIPIVILDYLKKENDHNFLKQLTNIMLYSDNFGIKYEICQIYKTLIETQLKEKSSDRMDLFSEPFKIILKYLNNPLSSYNNLTHQKKIEISSTKQIIIEILITWFSLMNFNKQFWIEENKLNEIISNILEEEDKVINLYAIKLLKCLINYTDPFICNKILSEKLCNNLISLFKNNMKKKNIIISCLMDFFESLSKNKELIFNNAMIFLSEFFYQNENQFKIILLRYEHKEIPKKELISYIRNDYREADLFLNDFDYKFMGDIFEDEDKTIDYLSKKRERIENSEELGENKFFDNYYKKYMAQSDYYNKINKSNELENEEGKNEDIFNNFEIDNINQNNDDIDEDDDEENKYYQISKK
jgi:protein phosphatase-4 regulatory subunit 3